MTTKSPVQGTLKKRVVQSFLWIAGTRYIGQAISWTITVAVARILSPKDYGLMGMAALFYSFLSMLIEMGMGAAIIQKRTFSREQLSSAYWVIVCSGLFFCALSFGLAPAIGGFFREDQVTTIIRILSFNFILISLSSVPYNLLAKEVSFQKTAKAEIIANIVGSGATLIMAMNGLGVWSLVFSYLVINTVKTVLIYVYRPWFPMIRMKFSEIRSMVNFGSKITGSSLLWFIYSNADFVIAGKMLGKEALGAYSLAFQLASLPLDKLISMINQVAFPAYSELQSDPARMRRYYLKVVRLVSFVALPVFTGLFLVSPDVIRIFLGARWEAAILPLKILLIISILRTLSVLHTPFLNAMNRPDITLANTAMCALIMPVSFWIGAMYGINGLALAWLAAYPVTYVAMFWNSVRIVKISVYEYVNQIRPVFLATGMMLVLMSWLQTTIFSDLAGMYRLVLTCCSGAFIFVTFTNFLNRQIITESISLLRSSKRIETGI